MKLLLTIVACIGCFYLGFAQQGKEAKVGLHSNPTLQNASRFEKEIPQKLKTQGFNKTSFSFNKAPSNNPLFPFTDWFEQDTTALNLLLWDSSSAHLNVQNQFVVFNAIDSGGKVYAPNNGSVGQTDVLFSNPIDASQSNGQLFITFTYSTGVTWQPDNQLALAVKLSGGSFLPVWTDSNTVANLSRVVVPIDLSLSNGGDTVWFKFVSKSVLSNTNTSAFLLKNVVVSDKLTIPFYENFTIANYNDANAASNVNWEHAQPNIFNDNSISGIRSVTFNAYNSLGALYNNNGFADTLLSQPFDMSVPPVSDSLYIRFLFKKYLAASSTDSLILDLLDSSNTWVNLWRISATQATGNYQTFLSQINLPQFRHANFQFRFINKCDYSATDTLQFGLTGVHIGKKIMLPFVDDFSADKLYPNSERWKDKQVYINNNFAIAQPSVNVATFDGLDKHGNAYGQGNGYLDSLTCWPINLLGLTKADSVYLSFYIEPQGWGEKPNEGDSLVLEFRNNQFNPMAWHTVWSGTSNQYPTNSFTKKTVFIDSVYLNDDFQFRFKNIGSRTGNINIWHVDYVVLDKGRSQNAGYFDFAMSSNPTSLLTQYYSMPRNHFAVNPNKYTNTNQQMQISNNDTAIVPLNFGRKIYDPEHTEISTFPNTSSGIYGETRDTVEITTLTNLNTSGDNDSLVFTSTYYTNYNNRIDNITTNDTLSVNTVFSNYFAYDDGTAESGYGIKNEPGAVALGYTLEMPDSLYGVSMFFNQSEVDVSTQSFTLVVWSNIGTKGDGTGETPIKKVYQARPTYSYTRNAFYYVQFNPPLYMPKGKFYIGWEQTNPFMLNMGWDENYVVNSVSTRNADLWYKVSDGYWRPTEFKGALMMRPIVGKWIDPPVGIVEVEKRENLFEAVVYPNPATDMLYVNTNTDNDTQIELIDIAGRKVAGNANNQKNISLLNLINGVYFVKVQDLQTGDIQVKKLLINK